jgi:hypothetical protein
MCGMQSARPKVRYDQEDQMMTASLRILSLHCALALALAAAIATVAHARAAIHAPTLASESGWQHELVNRPGCGSDGDYESGPACEAGHR